MRFWTTGWALGQVGVGGGVPHHPPDSLVLAVVTQAQAGLLGRGASGRACSQSSPHSSATDLVPPAALAGEQTENQRNQTTQTRAQSPARDRVLRVASSNAAPSLSGLLPLHHPPPLHVCEAVQTRGKMRPRAPQGREPHTSRWPSQEGTFFYISPHPESESGMQKPTPS